MLPLLQPKHDVSQGREVYFTVVARHAQFHSPKQLNFDVLK